MKTYRLGLLLAVAAFASGITLDAASARRTHRPKVVHRPERVFVFPSPESAAVTSFAGKVGGYMSPGILGATTADPYEHRGYGYYVGGGRGPGYSYYGD